MRSSEDRISQLPDEILVTILSHFNIVEASSTSVLSRRWQYLWTQVEVLHFYFPKMLRAIEKRFPYDSNVSILADKYVDWVNRVIRCHQGPHITDFKVVFPICGIEFRYDVDKWLSFAIRKSVERLEINLCGYTHVGERFRRLPDLLEYQDVKYRPPYTPPKKFYSLIKSPFGLSCIKSLMQLSLTCVNVTEELVEHFLSNCPLLVGLRVCLSKHLVNLKIAGPSLRLKFLEISRCLRLRAVDIIHAPNLASLISDALGRNQVVVRHAPSLVDLTTVATEGFFKVLPASYFPQLESLTLSFNLPWNRAPLIHPEFTSLKNLTFGGYAGKGHSFLDWTFLIEKAPLLHTFTLQLMSHTRIRKEIEILPTELHLHRCLEVVKFAGNIDFELLDYFYERAVVLNTIIVDCRHPSLEPWQELEEDESPMELRNLALDLKIQLAPKINVVVCS